MIYDYVYKIISMGGGVYKPMVIFCICKLPSVFSNNTWLFLLEISLLIGDILSFGKEHVKMKERPIT